MKITRFLRVVWLAAATLNPAMLASAEDKAPAADAKRPAVATVMPSTDVDRFDSWQDSRFSTFFYDTTVDFSQYEKAIFFPMTFDRMELSDNTNDDFKASWQKSSFEEMDKICQYFDDFVIKKFKGASVMQSTLQGGPEVLAIEFRMKDFMPTSMRREDALDTVGESSNRIGVGALRFQAVLVESQSGRLVAVIEDGVTISSGSYTIDNPLGRNLAWRRTFQRVIDDLHHDLKTLKKNAG